MVAVGLLRPHNAHLAWYHKFDMGYRLCPIAGCYDRWKITFKMTTGPGETGSKTDITFTVFGSETPSNPKIRSVVYANGSSVSDVTNTWTPVNSVIQWNSPHTGIRGKTFQAWYELSVQTPGGTLKQEYKTTKTSACAKPTNGAFRCVFPANPNPN